VRGTGLIFNTHASSGHLAAAQAGGEDAKGEAAGFMKGGVAGDVEVKR
jgi:hypothetical protein